MISTMTMTCSAGGKRARAMVFNDPAPTVEQQTKRGLLVDAGAMVLYKEPHIDALPLKAMPPAGREEPPCLRKHYLVGLKLRADLPVHFLGERVLENSDIHEQQNRFRLPGGDLCIDVLHKILSLEDLDSANLLYEIATRPRTKPLRQQSEPDNGTAYEEQGKSKKITGRAHGGLRVKLVDLFAGDKELILSRWDSKKCVVIKGEGYDDFIRKCSFNKHDVVEVWAFKQHSFYNFGKMLCHDSLLHVLIIKKDQQPHCKYCDCHLPQ